MNRILLGLVVGLMALVATSRLSRSEPQPAPTTSAVEAVMPKAVTAPPSRPGGGGDPRLASPAVSVLRQPVDLTPTISRLARLESRRRLEQTGKSTYLDSLFTTPDSIIRRWGDRAVIRLAIEPENGKKQLADEVRAALRAWEELRLGLTVVEIQDTVGADVVVSWVERFEPTAGSADEGPARTGLTELRSGGSGEIRSARILLARTDGRGAPLSLVELRAVATHEFGHALGLPHSADRGDIMYPTVIVPRLSDRDRASMSLLYGLPPGSLREPVTPAGL